MYIDQVLREDYYLPLPWLIMANNIFIGCANHKPAQGGVTAAPA
jgi:hypothetical protein